MRSFCTTWLILLGTATCAGRMAHAQSGPSDPYAVARLPQVSAPRESSGVQPVSYSSDPLGGSSATLSATSAEKTGYRSEFAEALSEPCGVEFDSCCNKPTSKFYAVALGLVMTRNRAPAFFTTTPANDPFTPLLNTEQAGAGWTGGGQATIGYAWRGVGGPTVAMTYWGLAEMSGSASVTDATGNPATALSSTLNFAVTMPNGNNAALYFDNAQQQAVWRHDRVDNVEVNFQTDTYNVRSFRISGLAGFRYFRFSEDLTYGSASFGNSFSSNGGANAGYLRYKCNNNLFGGQLGAIFTSVLTNRLTAFAVPKFGIFGNQMNNQSLLYTGDTANTPESTKTSKSDVSGLAELDFGLTWAFHPNWQLIGGYRVVSVTNLSLADNQFGAFGTLEQGGSLILHGAFFGLDWMF
jgi:hypothetical protein